jgi:hypothetical protein
MSNNFDDLLKLQNLKLEELQKLNNQKYNLGSQNRSIYLLLNSIVKFFTRNFNSVQAQVNNINNNVTSITNII